MKIRPKIPIFQDGKNLPSTVTWTNPNSTWFTRSGNVIIDKTFNMLKSLHDKWKSSGKLEDYLAYKRAVDNLNSNLRYGYAPGHMKYKSGNNQLFRGYRTDVWQNYVKNNYSFINDALGEHSSLYHTESSSPNSGDNKDQGWKVDNLWAGETDDRTTWGNLLDPTDPNYNHWKDKFAEIGIDYRTSPEWNTGDALFGFLKEPYSPPTNPDNKPELTDVSTSNGKTDVPTDGGKKYGFDWSKIREASLKLLGNPDLYAVGRLVGNLRNNDRVYDELLKGINPVLKQSYHTYRQVYGDEATRQGYYRRAALGEARAARPFTSDADRQVAYMMEAKRVGDELRAQGDLADNAEIRRTSDESNQHQWANTQRDNEVANYNTASINQADSLRHNLLAQKHSAQWSSIDNFLQGIEYRKRLKDAEINAINDQIFALKEKDEITNDKEYNKAYQAWKKIYDANVNPTTGLLNRTEDVILAEKEWNQALNDARRRSLERMRRYKISGNLYAKSGTKITHKKKDDLLYKSAKDVVEHFRKMSKQSSDAQNRKQPKIEKLTSHPKGKTSKYLLGGVAPFTVYKPVALGGETTTSSETGTSRTKDSDGLDLMKELFKSLAVEGLPSDVNSIYYTMNSLLERLKAFDNELTSDDIASVYLQLMLKINTIKFNKALFDLVSKTVADKDAGFEYAVDLYGRIAVLNTESGKIEYKKWEDVKDNLGKLNPLTNNDLLNLRAYSQAFSTDLLQVASNATSMSEIAKFLKAQLPNIGSSETTIEGYTKLDSNLIRNGILLLKDAPAGDYKFSQYTKDQLKQALMALSYLENILPKNMKTLLEVNSEINGKSPKAIIATMIGSSINENSKLELDAVTGKAAKDMGDMIPAVAFFQGLGELNTFVIADKTSDGLRINTISAPITSKGSNTGLITFDLLASTDFGGQLRIDSATMGDLLIAPNGGNNIIIGERIYLTELPIDKNAASKGIIKPDLSFLKNIEKADALLKQQGIDKSDPKNIPIVNKIYQENGLPIVYTMSGNKPELTFEYARFAMVNATATEDAFGESPKFNDGVSEISDKERDLFQTMMLQLTKNSKYKLDNGWGPFGGTKVYNGIIYIPMVTSTISALGGTGYKGTATEYNLIESLQQQANAARQMGFKPAGNNL